MTLFEHLENLTVHKRRWKQLTEDEQKTASMYMINRFLSMNYAYIEMVNELQQLNLPQGVLYEMYLSLIPKQKIWLKYIKKTSKDANSEPAKLIAEVFELSQLEADSYINLLTKDQLTELKLKVEGYKEKKNGKSKNKKV